MDPLHYDVYNLVQPMMFVQVVIYFVSNIPMNELNQWSEKLLSNLCFLLESCTTFYNLVQPLGNLYYIVPHWTTYYMLVQIFV